MKKSGKFWKQIVALCISGICISSQIIGIFAADTVITAKASSAGGKTTTLTKSYDADYEVIIPELVSLDSSLNITAEKINTEPAKAVKVRIIEGLSNGRATLDRNDDNSNYAITVPVLFGSTEVTESTVVAEFSNQSTSALETANGILTFGTALSPDEKPIKAGDYTGSLTFAISYEAE